MAYAVKYPFLKMEAKVKRRHSPGRAQAGHSPDYLVLY